MMRTRHSRIVATILVSALVVAACGDDEGDGASSTSDASAATNSAVSGAEGTVPAGTGDPIVVGIATGQTGFMAPYDSPGVNAVHLALEDINASGGLLGRQLEAISADTRSDLLEGKRAGESLVADGADVMIVSCDFDYGSPAALAANEAGVVAFSLCAASEKFGPSGIGPLAYTSATVAANEGAAGAAFAAKQGWEAPFILSDDTLTYPREVLAGFRDAWTAASGEDSIAGEATHKNEDASIASQITAMQNSDADFIYVTTYPPGASSVIRQIRAAGVDLPILGTQNLDGTAWIDAIPDMSDVYATVVGGSTFGDDPNPQRNELVERYTERFGEAPPSGQFYGGYAAMEALAIAIEAAGSVEGEAVAAELNQFLNVETVVGAMTFDEDNHITLERPMPVIVFEGGAARYADTAEG